MSGHSKWSTIKRQKGANDAKRSQLFTKLANTITTAVREGGGGDLANNIKLRYAVDKARAENMSTDNIDRAIERGLGRVGTTALETVVYEGYGPSKAAVIVKAITDNRNRTGAEVKTAFEKAGGALEQPGALAWQFEHQGVVMVTGRLPAEEFQLKLIDQGANDVIVAEDGFKVYTDPTALHQLSGYLEKHGYQTTSAKLTMHPKQLLVLNAEATTAVLAFLDRIKSLDDVAEVYTNVKFTT